MLKKLVTATALLVTTLSAIAPTAQADPPDNFGQCIQWANELGFSPSEMAPGRYQDHEHYPGPAVIIYDAAGNIVAVHKANGFTFGVACSYFGATDVQARHDVGNHTLFVLTP